MSGLPGRVAEFREGGGQAEEGGGVPRGWWKVKTFPVAGAGSRWPEPDDFPAGAEKQAILPPR